MAKITGSKIIEELETIEVHQNIIDKVRNRLELLKEKNFKIVLSLAGGAAKGVVGNAAFLYFLDRYDMMHYFEEVWGVSAGSMVGGAYLAGVSINKLMGIIASVRLRDFIPISISMPFPTNRINDFFGAILPVENFKDLNKSFYVLATNYTPEHQSIDIFHTGDLADAITASITLPHIFTPFQMDGNVYFDGGLVENTPNKSVLRNHKKQSDKRRMSIISTCFGKADLKPNDGNPISNLINTLAYYRYRLQLEQNEYVRSQPGCYQLMFNFEINNITKLQFNKMGPEIVPAYGQLLDKLSYICEKDAWNIDY